MDRNEKEMFSSFQQQEAYFGWEALKLPFTLVTLEQLEQYSTKGPFEACLHSGQLWFFAIQAPMQRSWYRCPHLPWTFVFSSKQMQHILEWSQEVCSSSVVNTCETLMPASSSMLLRGSPCACMKKLNWENSSFVSSLDLRHSRNFLRPLS